MADSYHGSVNTMLERTRAAGESTWVCVKCLPALIHG